MHGAPTIERSSTTNDLVNELLAISLHFNLVITSRFDKQPNENTRCGKHNRYRVNTRILHTKHNYVDTKCDDNLHTYEYATSTNVLFSHCLLIYM